MLWSFLVFLQAEKCRTRPYFALMNIIVQRNIWSGLATTTCHIPSFRFHTKTDFMSCKSRISYILLTLTLWILSRNKVCDIYRATKSGILKITIQRHFLLNGNSNCPTFPFAELLSEAFLLSKYMHTFLIFYSIHINWLIISINISRNKSKIQL